MRSAHFDVEEAEAPDETHDKHEHGLTALRLAELCLQSPYPYHHHNKVNTHEHPQKILKARGMH